MFCIFKKKHIVVALFTFETHFLIPNLTPIVFIYIKMKRWVNDSLAHSDLSNSCGLWCGSTTMSSHILTSLGLPSYLQPDLSTCLDAWREQTFTASPPLCLVGNLILPRPFLYFTSLLDLTCFWTQPSAALSICCLICLFSKENGLRLWFTF